MRGKRRARLGLALWLLLGGLAACAPLGGTTPPSRFYLLTPLEPPPQRSDGPQLGVGPIRLAEYLDRPQIVTRRGEHELELAEFDRWGEPLEDGIARVLMTNLGALLGTDRAQRQPWRNARGIEVQLDVDVQRFDGPAAGPVELVAHWRLQRGGRLMEHTSRVSEPLPVPGYDGQAAAMSRALQRLAREIAEALPAAADAPPR